MQSRCSIHLQPSNDEVEEEGHDGEQVDEVHGAHEELQLAGGTREPDLKQPQQPHMTCHRFYLRQQKRYKNDYDFLRSVLGMCQLACWVRGNPFRCGEQNETVPRQRATLLYERETRKKGIQKNVLRLRANDRPWPRSLPCPATYHASSSLLFFASRVGAVSGRRFLKKLDSCAFKFHAAWVCKSVPK